MRPVRGRERMQRVIVIGSGGAGKSFFSRQLADVTGLPLHHLDSLYWQPGWKEPGHAEWHASLQALLSRPAWILDGNFGGSLEARIAASDTVIFIDTPAWVCLWRVVVRRIRHHGQSRPDMAAGCHERLDPGFIGWILGYRFQRRPAILRRLDALRHEKQVVVIRSGAQAREFLDCLKQQAAPSTSLDDRRLPR